MATGARKRVGSGARPQNPPQAPPRGAPVLAPSLTCRDVLLAGRREPPATAPSTEPPAAAPPATEPLAAAPPSTEPPAAKPLATEPPATEPPAAAPPTRHELAVEGNRVNIGGDFGVVFKATDNFVAIAYDDLSWEWMTHKTFGEGAFKELTLADQARPPQRARARAHTRHTHALSSRPLVTTVALR